MKRRRKNRLRNILVPALLPLSLVLMLLPTRAVQPARDAVLTVTGPVELGMSRLLDLIAGLPARLRLSSRLLEENSALSTHVVELKSEVDFLKTRLTESQKLIAQLRDLKQVLPATGYEPLPACIVNKHPVPVSGRGSSHTFVIGVGTREGVQRDDLVVTGYAVVGKICTVSPLVSTVRLVTHADFGIAARTANGIEGVLQGQGNHGCLLKYVGTRPAIEVGDYVLTSGFRGKHPAGLLLGTVEDVVDTYRGTSVRVEVKPAANFQQVSQVIVVRRHPDR
ncbi:MAG TPA: rod shape-determining protein MreC [Planctomycetota bacterium]|nr:rod shape-determining protein MreC [Planctomycetota bacterium]